MRRSVIASAAIGLILGLLAGGAARAEAIRIGLTRIANSGVIAVARDKGYFAEEGLEPELAFFDAQQPIAVGVAGGDLDFGIGAHTAALYTLAGQGTLRIIAGGVSENPTFHYLAYVVSNQAYAAGFTSPDKAPGHSFALTQLGSGLQYNLGLMAAKHGFDVKSVSLLPLQSNSNIASAIAGGRADFAIFQSTGALPLIERGEAKLLGWVGDDTGRHQANFVFAGTKILERPDIVARFLNALRKGARVYHDAFTAPDETRRDGPAAPDILAILVKYLDQPLERVKLGIPYLDAGARVDMAEMQRQIDWYRAQGLLKSDVTAAAIVERRYLEPEK